MTKTETKTITEIMRNFEIKTNDKIEKIHINQATMGEQIQNIEKNISSIDGKLDEFIKCADSKYANKKMVDEQLKVLERDRIGKLEKSVYGIAFLIVATVIGALLSFVIIK